MKAEKRSLFLFFFAKLTTFFAEKKYLPLFCVNESILCLSSPIYLTETSLLLIMNYYRDFSSSP